MAKHHYIPQCYLKRWIGADRELCEYKRINGRVVTRRTPTAGTGWVYDLYAVTTYPPEHREIVEEVVFGRVDNDAERALACLIEDRPMTTGRELDGWSRFLMSLMNRSPERVQEIRDMVTTKWGEITLTKEDEKDDPEGYADWQKGHNSHGVGELFAEGIRGACDMQTVGEVLNNMHKEVLTIFNGRGRFMTSDVPLIYQGTLNHPDAHVLLPLTPSKLYVACNDPKLIRRIERKTAEDVTDFVNRTVIRQAYRYAYGLCENHRPLVEEVGLREF